jgi:serine/threonine protein kinase
MTQPTVYLATKFLAEGSFGAVYKVVNRQDPNDVKVVKTFQSRAFSTSAITVKEKLAFEAKVQEAVGMTHVEGKKCYPGILCYYDTRKTTLKISKPVSVDKQSHTYHAGEYLLMEYLPGHTLLDVYKCQVEQGYRLSAKQMKVIMKSLLTTLTHLHTLGFAHRDLKLENIMFSRDRLVVIDTDFMCAPERADLACVNAVGTKEYFSPELTLALDRGRIFDRNIFFSSDVWALGVCFYALAHIYLGKVATLPTPELAAIINAMLTQNYQLRPSASRLLERINKV